MYGAGVNPAGAPVGYGIDFGTSNSAISVAYADRVEVLALGPSRSTMTLPSFVYLHRGGRRAAGAEAGKTFPKTRPAKTDAWNQDLAPVRADSKRSRSWPNGGQAASARRPSTVSRSLWTLAGACSTSP